MRTEGEANHIEDIHAPSFLIKNEAFLALPSKSQKRRWRKTLPLNSKRRRTSSLARCQVRNRSWTSTQSRLLAQSLQNRQQRGSDEGTGKSQTEISFFSIFKRKAGCSTVGKGGEAWVHQSREIWERLREGLIREQLSQQHWIQGSERYSTVKGKLQLGPHHQ